MTAEGLADYLSVFLKDSRLNVWHLAILVAILHMANVQAEGKRIHVSRSKIMKFSHINTIPTYHKYFKELQIMGYIRYAPSYHPGIRSLVELLV